MRPSSSIVAVAAIQLLGSMTILVVCGLFSADEIRLYHLYPHTYEFLDPAVYLVYMILPSSFALLGKVTSVGLLLLRDWARKAGIFLSIVPALGCALLVLLRPRSVFP